MEKEMFLLTTLARSRLTRQKMHELAEFVVRCVVMGERDKRFVVMVEGDKR
jgi:hypothetical protein